MSMTKRGDQAAGILRQHDTLGVFPIPDVCFAEKFSLQPLIMVKLHCLLFTIIRIIMQ